MKKIVFALVVMLLAAPAWAVTVDVYCEQVDTNAVEIRYATDGNRPRAFGLDITVDKGTIVSCDPCMVGECTVTAQGFGIFPGTIDIAGDGTVNDYGTPVSPNDLPDTLPGLDSNGITIEMGSLYVDTNYPADSGVLCTIVVSDTDCCVEIAGNVVRTGNGGTGVVMENPDEIPDVNFTGCCLEGCPCLGDIADTSSIGPPDGKVDTGDMAALLTNLILYGDPGNNYEVPSPSELLLSCGDIADTTSIGPPDGKINTGDMAALLTHLILYGDPGNNYEAPCIILGP